MSSRLGRLLATALVLLLLGPGAAFAVATQVQIQSPAGEPIESDYLVLDPEGETVAEGRTDARGEDEQDLRPGVYLFRAGDRERRVEIREGEPATVSLTRSLVGLRRWGFDVGATYGYRDQDGSLASEIDVFTDRESSGLQLNGTAAGLYGRVRFPVEALGGQPFVQLEGDLPLSDAEDTGGLSGQPGFTETSSLRLRYRSGLRAAGGVEWETPPLHGDRGLRVRPHAGFGVGWWEGTLENDRSAFAMGFESEEDDFSTTTGFLGVDLGVPLCACESTKLDLVFGGRFGFPLGDDEESFEMQSGGGTDVLGEVDFDEHWRVYTGLELRWSPRLSY